MNLKKLVELVDGEILTDNFDFEKEIPCAFGSDLISDILMCTTETTLLLTGLTNPQIIRLSDMIDLVAILFVRGKTPPKQIIEMANERNLPMIKTKLTLFQTSGILYNNGLRSCKINE